MIWLQAFLIATLLATTQPVRADAGFIHALPEIALAQPCGAADTCSYTWTLGSRLGDALSFAEARYGKRDMSWTLLGVEFAAVEAPQIWYPGYSATTRNALVQLTESTALDEKQALYQLSHEVVHLLSPTGPDLAATVLEEGLAAYNSIEYTRAAGFDIAPGYIASPAYEAAYAAIVELEAVQPDFAAGVRKLRLRRGSLSDISADDLRAVFPDISRALAERLAATF